MLTRSICSLLVSSFLKDVVQHIHSLRASGVSSFHFESTFESEANAFRKSVGTLCTTPVAIIFPIVSLVLYYKEGFINVFVLNLDFSNKLF